MAHLQALSSSTPHKVPESTERELPRHETGRLGLLCPWVGTAFVDTAAPSTQEHKNIILKKDDFKKISDKKLPNPLPCYEII